jgi:hypothetical protein
MRLLALPKSLRYGFLVFCVLAVAALAGVAGFVTGRHSTPTKIESKATVAPKGDDDNYPFSVAVTKEARAVGGIEVAALAQAGPDMGAPTVGTVVDLSPLWDFASRYASAASDVASSRAVAEAARSEFKRVGQLYADNQNASEKALEAAHAAADSAQAKADAAEIALRNLEAAAREQFGKVLTAWAIEPSSAHLESLRKQHGALIRVSLPAASDQKPAGRVHILTGGNTETASLVSAASQVDLTLQRTSYFYLLGRPLPVNARVDVVLPQAKDEGPYVVIPATAVVWYGGEPWVYVEAEGNRFERHPIATDRPAIDHYLVASNAFEDDARIAVRGVQLLLSEELRGMRESGNAGGDSDD